MSVTEFNRMLLSQAEFLKPFAITLTRDNEDAKDLIQETLCRALANKEKYNVGTNIKAWLYTIMRNVFINDYRRSLKQPVVFEISPKDFLLNFRRLSTCNDAIANMNIKQIRETIYHLPVVFKNPFLLYFEGYKYGEIADILREPLGTIKSRIHFARKLLKTSISEYS